MPHLTITIRTSTPVLRLTKRESNLHATPTPYRLFEAPYTTLASTSNNPKKQVCHTITYSAHSMWNSSPPTPTVHHTVHNAVANTEQFNSRPQRLPYSLLILNRLNNTYMPLLTITCMLYIRAKFKQEPSAFPNYQLSTFALLGRYAAYVRSSLPTFRKKWHR